MKFYEHEGQWFALDGVNYHKFNGKQWEEVIFVPIIDEGETK